MLYDNDITAVKAPEALSTATGAIISEYGAHANSIGGRVFIRAFLHGGSCYFSFITTSLGECSVRIPSIIFVVATLLLAGNISTAVHAMSANPAILAVSQPDGQA